MKENTLYSSRRFLESSVLKIKLLKYVCNVCFRVKSKFLLFDVVLNSEYTS